MPRLMFLPVLFLHLLLVARLGFAAPIGLEKSADEGQTSSTTLVAPKPTTVSLGQADFFRVIFMHMFDQADSDANGVVTCDEFVRAMMQSSPAKFHDAKFVFQVLDSNGDGHLTREELLAIFDGNGEKMLRRMFDLSDRNHDGWLTKAELEYHVGLFGGQEELDVLFSEMDTNRDGRLSVEEVIARMLKKGGRRGAIGKYVK